jgi:hypothetical protein
MSVAAAPTPPTPAPTATRPLTGAAARRISWSFQIVAAAILAMTLPFKFTGAPETVALFQELGAGDAGRIGSAVMETIAVLMLLTPRLAGIGGLLTLGVMGGAILSHLAILGIVWDGDASLFTMAVIAFVSAGIVTWIRLPELPIVGRRLG